MSWAVLEQKHSEGRTAHGVSHKLQYYLLVSQFESTSASHTDEYIVLNHLVLGPKKVRWQLSLSRNTSRTHSFVMWLLSYSAEWPSKLEDKKLILTCSLCFQICDGLSCKDADTKSHVTLNSAVNSRGSNSSWVKIKWFLVIQPHSQVSYPWRNGDPNRRSYNRNILGHLDCSLKMAVTLTEA